MGCPRGLIKLTAVANNLEAWRGWEKLKASALEQGIDIHLIEDISPPDGAGWRVVDKAIVKLREIMRGER